MFIYSAELYCDSCGRRIVAELRANGVADEGDSDGFPQYGNDGGKSDSPNHCASVDCLEAINLGDYGLAPDAPLYGAETRKIGALIDEQLTEHGVAYLREMLDEQERTPYQRALHRFWRAAFADELA